MKKVLLLMILFCLPDCMTAQIERDFLPVEWKTIAKKVKKDPEYVKGLVARLAADEFDPSLTFPDCILAFYGQSFLTNDSEETMVMNLYNLRNEGKTEEGLAAAKKILDVNPLNLDALMTAGMMVLAMAADTTQWKDVTVEAAEPYLERARRIFETIAMTGDGSAAHPFYVTKVSDEYNLMRFYLNLWKYKKQTATECCDIITLDGTSEQYKLPEIYFEITRVYELEHLKLFK